MKIRCTISRGFGRRRGFSLVEVLMAVMILGIGLIMVTAVFPVGANWTRQNLEESVAGIVARNAVAIIQTKYTFSDMTGINNTLQEMPGIVAGVNPAILPLPERAYRFGNDVPYRSKDLAQAQTATYFWTAMVRRSSGPIPERQNSFDLYIFVFKKGATDQTFTPAGAVIGRDTANDSNVVPCLVKGTITGNTGFVVGSQGVGAVSGTVFRKLSDDPASPIITNIPLATGDTDAYYALPADATVTSPLVYIYQTTISF